MAGSGPIQACGFVIFRREGGEVRFLLLKSARDGYWGMPKGHLRPGEKRLEAAFRELKEETGYDDVSVVKGFRASIYYQVIKEEKPETKRVDYFLAEKKGPLVELSQEHLEYRWATLSEVQELLSFDNLREVVRNACRALAAQPGWGRGEKKSRHRDVWLILPLIILLGVAVRTKDFYQLGYTDRDAFPIESALRYRYISMVARGEGIPGIDRAVQYPDGFNTRTDTIAQEYLVGYAYRLFAFTGITLEVFLRYFLRLLWVLTVIPIYLIALRVTGSRGAAMVSALFFAVAMPSLRRSLGNEIYREHITFLPLGLHFYYLLRALGLSEGDESASRLERKDGGTRAFYAYALLSAVFLLLSLAGWKVNRYYYLTLMVFFLFMMPFSSRRAAMLKLLTVFAVVNTAASLLFNTPLKYDFFPFSTGMILTYALLAAGSMKLLLDGGPRAADTSSINRKGRTTHPHFKPKALIPIMVFLAAAGVLWAVRPETGYYTHVWETLFARLRYLSKPLLPSLLPFEARHYWVPPYTTPTPFMFINDFLVPLLAASMAGGIYLRRLFKSESRPEEVLLLYMLAAFLGFYLLFYKLMTFLVFFTAVFMALSLSRAKTMSKVWRYLTLLLVFASVGLGLYQSQTWENNYLARGLTKIGFKPLSIPQAVPEGATEKLLEWFRTDTEKQEATLADFPVSAALVAYTGRPIVLQTLFEGENRFRFREFSFVLTGDEQRLYVMMSKYRARYFVYSAHFLLRTDRNMSYRYTADAMKIDKSWTIYKMHFHPERLKRFALVYQNSVFRVFRLLDEGEEAAFGHPGYAPLFDERLMERLSFSVPAGVTQEEAFLYTIVSAYDDMRAGRRLMAGGRHKRGLELLLRSLETFPFIPETHSILSTYYAATGDAEKAEIHARKARALNSGRWEGLFE
jgi:8-oxo-dGTP pyrophosphatase MutT (NUDIX family)